MMVVYRTAIVLHNSPDGIIYTLMQLNMTVLIVVVAYAGMWIKCIEK